MAKRKLKKNKVCRCAASAICGEPNCRHHPPHSAGVECLWPSYCRILESFVEDIPLSEIKEAEECDPNLVFLKRRHGGHHK